MVERLTKVTARGVPTTHPYVISNESCQRSPTTLNIPMSEPVTKPNSSKGVKTVNTLGLPSQRPVASGAPQTRT